MWKRRLRRRKMNKHFDRWRKRHPAPRLKRPEIKTLISRSPEVEVEANAEAEANAEVEAVAEAEAEAEAEAAAST